MLHYCWRIAVFNCVLVAVLQVYGAFVEAVCSASDLQPGVSTLLELCSGNTGDSIGKAWEAGTWAAELLGFFINAAVVAVAPSLLYLNELTRLTQRPAAAAGQADLVEVDVNQEDQPRAMPVPA